MIGSNLFQGVKRKRERGGGDETSGMNYIIDLIKKRWCAS